MESRRNFVFIGAVVLALIVLFLFVPMKGKDLGIAPSDVPTISANDLRALMVSEEPVLILDVRKQEEFDAGHIDDAVLLPLDTLPEHYEEIPRDEKVVVYCRTGKRSAKAASFFKEKGFDNILSLSGGYVEWIASAPSAAVPPDESPVEAAPLFEPSAPEAAVPTEGTVDERSGADAAAPSVPEIADPATTEPQ